MADPLPLPPIADPSLETCDGCSRQMDVSTFEPFSRVKCSCGQERRVKTVFGNYRLLRRHAVGGMSVIFVAWDETLDREVAVKILNAEYSVDRTRVAQFEAEARLTASIRNPNVVQVYTVGMAYGRFYLVMELLEGESLEKRIAEEKKVPEGEMLQIGKQVVAGLKAANDVGVIHRDVKPGNILIEESGEVKLIDFGLALLTQGGQALASEIWATPYYVPPEVLDQKPEDFRSDLYALGATLYHITTGRPPFFQSSTNTKELRDRKKTILSLGKAAPWIHPKTGQAIDRMMSFERRQRPKSYVETLLLLEEAEKYIEAAQGKATPKLQRGRQQRQLKRRQIAMVVLQIVSGVILGLSIWKLVSVLTAPDVTDKTAKKVALVDYFDGLSPESFSELQKNWEVHNRGMQIGDFAEADEALTRLTRHPESTEQVQGLGRALQIALAYLANKPDEGATLWRTKRASLEALIEKTPALDGLEMMYSTAEKKAGTLALSAKKKPACWVAGVVMLLQSRADGQDLPKLSKSLKESEVPKSYPWAKGYWQRL